MSTTAYEQHRLQIELREQARERAQAALTRLASELATLRRAAAAHFRALTDGKTYSRKPAQKVVIPEPGVVEGETRGELIVAPEVLEGGRRRARVYTVVPTVIHLTFGYIDRFSATPGRRSLPRRFEPWVTVVLKEGVPPRLFGCRVAHADSDQERLARVVTRFLNCPDETIALSGTHCCFCTRPLTDPESRQRGIGPECHKHYTDFVRFLGESLDQGDTPETPPGLNSTHTTPKGD